MIIAIDGKRSSGKTSVARHIFNTLDEKYPGKVHLIQDTYQTDEKLGWQYPSFEDHGNLACMHDRIELRRYEQQELCSCANDLSMMLMFFNSRKAEIEELSSRGEMVIFDGFWCYKVASYTRNMRNRDFYYRSYAEHMLVPDKLLLLDISTKEAFFRSCEIATRYDDKYKKVEESVGVLAYARKLAQTPKFKNKCSTSVYEYKDETRLLASAVNKEIDLLMAPYDE